MNLDIERMEGFGEFIVDGYRVNYLFGLKDLCEKYIKNDFSILELGVNNGVSTSFFCKNSKSVIAVDLQKTEKFKKVLSENSNLTFYQMSFSDFFKMNKLSFDFIYIDGSHRYEDVKEDINNSIKALITVQKFFWCCKRGKKSN
jgi:hypothetical protein